MEYTGKNIAEDLVEDPQPETKDKGVISWVDLLKPHPAYYGRNNNTETEYQPYRIIHRGKYIKN
jgi:hypothetical protein